MTLCPRCGTSVEPGQEYCLGCGGRLPRSRAYAPGDGPATSWLLRAAGALAVAVAGGALAVAAGTGSGDASRLLTATGGFATVPDRGTLPGGSTGVPSPSTSWPPGQEGWTIVLASIPQTKGRGVAAARAREARRSGLELVGVLDSSSFASLHPGYWIVFTGVYTSEAAATSELERARRSSRTAAVARIVR